MGKGKWNLVLAIGLACSFGALAQKIGFFFSTQVPESLILGI
jgi:hypothetical protein